ncbi:MAG: MATE family efflux transporter, partial [Candidatus Tumulicola sp.]
MIVDHRDVGAAFRRLSLPVAAQMLGDQILGIVDTIAIGSLGAVALAGATAASAILTAVLFSIFGLLTGTSIIAAQRIGADDVDGFARTLRAGAIVPFAVALAGLALGIFFSKPAVHALVGDLPSAGASAQYLTLRLASALPIVISGTIIIGLGAAGNRIVGVLVLVAINLVHIPLLLMLGLGWWTHHPLGIAGAGISSLLSETFGCICAIAYVWRKPAYRVFASWKISWATARECTRLGLPESIFLAGVMLPDIAVVAMLAPLGAPVVAAFRALNVVS